MCIQMRGYQHVGLHVCVRIYVGVNPKKVCENMQVPAVESGGTVSQPGPRDALLQSFLFSIPSPTFSDSRHSLSLSGRLPY